ncbi:MAG: M56 family metallopeptidase [Pirellulales bacterium]
MMPELAWFHPLIWWTCRQLTRERERSCDAAVLAVLRSEPPAYAQCLLDVLPCHNVLTP